MYGKQMIQVDFVQVGETLSRSNQSMDSFDAMEKGSAIEAEAPEEFFGVRYVEI